MQRRGLETRTDVATLVCVHVMRDKSRDFARAQLLVARAAIAWGWIGIVGEGLCIATVHRNREKVRIRTERVSSGVCVRYRLQGARPLSPLSLSVFFFLSLSLCLSLSSLSPSVRVIPHDFYRSCFVGDLCVFLYESASLPRRDGPLSRGRVLMLGSESRLPSDNAPYRCRARYVTRDVTGVYATSSSNSSGSDGSKTDGGRSSWHCWRTTGWTTMDRKAKL